MHFLFTIIKMIVVITLIIVLLLCGSGESKDIQQIDLAFLIDQQFQKSVNIPNNVIFQTVDHINRTTNNLANVNSEIITDFEAYKEHRIEECSKHTMIVSAMPCKQTKQVIDMVQIYCKSTIVMSLVSPVCKRPTYEQGIAFPVLRKDDENYISLLVDFKANIIKKWKNIGLIYDQTVDQLTVDAIQLGIEQINDAGVEPSSVLKLPLYDQESTASIGANQQLWNARNNRETKSDFDSKLNRTLEHIRNDDDLNSVLLIASHKTITEIVTNAYREHLLVHPKKWLIIFTDTTEIDQKLNQIFSKTDVSVIVRDNLEQVCKPRTDGCQLKLLMETFHQAIKKVLLDSDYNFNNKLKHKTKNRIMSEMRRYLDATEYIKDQLQSANYRSELDEMRENLDKMDSVDNLTLNRTYLQAQGTLDSVYGKDKLEDELKSSLYCGNCDRFVLKSFERRSQIDRKRKNKLQKVASNENWIERTTIWTHGMRIFHNEKNVHPISVYRDSMDLLNLRLKLRSDNKMTQQQNVAVDLDGGDREERLNNVYDVHRHIPIKRSIDYHEVKIETRATWQPFKGLLQAANDPVLQNVGSLSGRHFRIGVVSQMPIINVVVDESGGCIVNGSTHELITVLKEQLNFTYEWVCSKEMEKEGVGHFDDKRGVWTGLLGLIAAKKIDLAANGFYRTPMRLRSGLFTFTHAYDEEVIKILVKKTEENNSWLFMTPFTYDTWYCVLLSVILIGPLLYWVHKSAKYYDYYGENDGESLFKLGNCIWYTFGAMIQQGGDHLPKAISGRLLVAFWWLFEIVTISTYSGNLVALLTFPKIIQPIENVDDLMSYWSMNWAVGQSTQIQEVLTTLKYGELMKLKPKMKVMNFEEDRMKIFKTIASGTLGFLMPETEARYWVSKEFSERRWCGMFVAKEPAYRASLHLILPKDQPEEMMRTLNREIYYCTRSGLTIYWRKNYEVLSDECMYPLIVHAGDVKKIAMQHMIGSFWVLAWGLAFAVFVLICEYVIYFLIQKGGSRFLLPGGQACVKGQEDPNYDLNKGRQTAAPIAPSMMNQFGGPSYIGANRFDPYYAPNYSQKRNGGIWTSIKEFLCCGGRLFSAKIDSANDRRKFFDPKTGAAFSTPYGGPMNYYGKNQMRLDDAANVMRGWAGNHAKMPNLNQYNLGNYQSNLQHRPKVYNNNIYKSQYSTVYSNVNPNTNYNSKYY